MVMVANKISQMKKLIAKFKKAWKAETPKFWKFIVGASAFIVVAVPVLASIELPNIPIPQWFTDNAWTVMGIATTIGLFAKTRSNNKATE